MDREKLLGMRVDQVGSLQRPERLRSAFSDFARGDISASRLAHIQDEIIRDVVRHQEKLRLSVVSDGEFRRVNFMESFGEVAGMEQWGSGMRKVIESLQDERSDPASRTMRGSDPTLHTHRAVTSRLRLMRNRPLEEFRFAQTLTDIPVKATLIDTDRICQGYDEAASRPFYSSSEEFLQDVISVQQQIVGELIQQGCRYVQMDGPSYTRYVDHNSLEVIRSQGADPAALLEQAMNADNAVIEGFHEAVFGMHLCRGNRQSMWHREGAYDEIAERLFHGLRHQRLLLEYDTERAGTFEPLRFVPKDKVVVLGLITTKVGRLETVDEIRRRIDEAARFLPLEQLALSPQCGFASDIRGNNITEDEQWRKLDLMMETARLVWGNVL